MKPQLDGSSPRWRKYALPIVLAAAISVPWVGANTAKAQDGGPGMEERMAEDGPRVDREQLRKEFRRRRGEHNRGDGMGGGDRLNRMGNFLKFVRSYQEAVKDPHDAAGFAILAVKESYKRQGKPEEAVKYLNGLLDQTSDQHLRNIILFNLKQLYEHQRDGEKAVAVSKQIVAENMKLIK